MTPQELRSSILLLAIQGKLVEQRPEEGTAEELYQQIQAEKRRLIKDGKIKKEKPLPEILESDVPYDIPVNWKWFRLGNIISLLSGTDFKPEEYNDQGLGTVYITGASNLSDNGVIVSRWTKTPRNMAHWGDVLLVCKGSGYGKTVICDVAEAHIARQIMAIYKMNCLEMKYVSYFLQANIAYIKMQGQGVIPGIDRQTILNMFYPLPPLAEQKRIVAKIEELLPYIDRYEQAWSKLEDFNKRFPVDMQKSILQMAIQGKLVEQRSEEGTGEELYQQIQAKKQKLIKEGKIKKEKPLPEIAEDEVPFDIPETWKWVKIGQVSTVQSSKRVFEKDYVQSGVPFFRSKEIGNLYRGEAIKTELYITPDHYQQLKNTYGVPQIGDILITSVGTIGNTWICDGREFYYKDGNITQICANEFIIPRYMELIIHSPLFESQAMSTVAGTAYSALTIIKLKNIIIPLPPLAEQKRIVARLEELLPLCDRLK